MTPRKPRAEWSDYASPPTTITVHARDERPAPALYRPDGTPLVRDAQIRFRQPKKVTK